MCYHFVDEELAYGDAESYCKDNFEGQLARVNTRAVWWVLGNKITDEARFVWISGLC